MRAFLQSCSRDYDDDLERQEDERAHQSTKQQDTSVTSLRECADEQLQTAEEQDGFTRNHETQEGCKSNMCILVLTMPYGVSGKEACNDMQELIGDKNSYSGINGGQVGDCNRP
jgi:hypothetical protein